MELTRRFNLFVITSVKNFTKQIRLSWKKITMPLSPKLIRTITGYYRKKLGYYTDFIGKFDFVDDKNFRERLAQEYYVARYIALMQDAMNFDENSYELLGHLKFQIVQYAGIYEAVISYLFKNNFCEDLRVQNLGKKKEYKLIQKLSKDILLNSNKPVYLCKSVEVKTDWNFINFKDKLDVAKEIGLIKEDVAKVVLDTYLLRHSVHVEKAVKDEIVFQQEQVDIAYETMDVFLSGIKNFLQSVTV